MPASRARRSVYGFLNRYDPAFVANFIDDTARYKFSAQPEIMRWNLERLADALTGSRFVQDRDKSRWWEKWPADRWLDAELARAALAAFEPTYRRCYAARMRLRLGLPPIYAHNALDGAAEARDGAWGAPWWRPRSADLGWTAALSAAGSRPDYHAALRALAEVDLGRALRPQAERGCCC